MDNDDDNLMVSRFESVFFLVPKDAFGIYWSATQCTCAPGHKKSIIYRKQIELKGHTWHRVTLLHQQCYMIKRMHTTQQVKIKTKEQFSEEEQKLPRCRMKDSTPLNAY